PELHVIADSPRRHAEQVGRLADAVGALVHADSSAGSATVSRKWYFPPRASEATAAIRQATNENPNATTSASWNGFEINRGKNERPASSRAFAGGSVSSVSFPSSVSIGL